jgi:cell division septal protein FtsQ
MNLSAPQKVIANLALLLMMVAAFVLCVVWAFRQVLPDDWGLVQHYRLTEINERPACFDVPVSLFEALPGRRVERLHLDALHADLMRWPGVRQAGISFAWPGHMRIALAWREPAYLWNGEALLDDSLTLIRPARLDECTVRVHLQGPEGSQARLAELYELVGQRLPPSLVLEALVFDPLKGFVMQLADGPEIRLGEESLEQRFLAVTQLLARWLDSGRQVANILYLDARYPDGVALKGRAPGAPVPVRKQL